MQQKLAISAGLMGHLARMQTLHSLTLPFLTFYFLALSYTETPKSRHTNIFQRSPSLPHYQNKFYAMFKQKFHVSFHVSEMEFTFSYQTARQ